LMEVRRTKQSVSTTTTAVAAPGADLTALKDQSTLFRSRRAEADKQLQGWIAAGDVKSGTVADILQDPYLEIRVQPASGKAPPTSAVVTVEGAQITIPVRAEK